MKCPKCSSSTRVTSMNRKDPEQIRRYRKCRACNHTFVTEQSPEVITERKQCLSRRGENNVNAKLTDAVVAEMRQYAAKGATSLECGLIWDVSQKVAWNAIVGRTWKHVPMPVTVKEAQSAIS